MKIKENKYLLSMDGKTFYGVDKEEKAQHIQGMTEAEAIIEIKNFPNPEEVKFYELVELF